MGRFRTLLPTDVDLQNASRSRVCASPTELIRQVYSPRDRRTLVQRAQPLAAATPRRSAARDVCHLIFEPFGPRKTRYANASGMIAIYRPPACAGPSECNILLGSVALHALERALLRIRFVCSRSCTSGAVTRSCLGCIIVRPAPASPACSRLFWPARVRHSARQRRAACDSTSICVNPIRGRRVRRAARPSCFWGAFSVVFRRPTAPPPSFGSAS